METGSEWCWSGVGPIQIPIKGIAASIPLGVLYDCATSFPSVGHAWLLLVLKCIKRWDAYYCAIRRTYENNHVYIDNAGFLISLFRLFFAILQGCPLSGTLFSFVIDPLPCMFRRHMNSAIVRACADDRGAAVKRLRDLLILHDMSALFETASGIVLKPAKMIIIHTVCDCNAENTSMVRQWLVENISSWKNMKILTCILNVWPYF